MSSGREEEYRLLHTAQLTRGLLGRQVRRHCAFISMAIVSADVEKLYNGKRTGSARHRALYP